ncbi:hypothetical protein MLD38_028255 [Melastoma candidum]|uniref:Uncharacterized protein n=1 Tax=Melastoma candidum TaxID=119954 RepID=A0ACB9N284_9MYRT|nr:hypothetical protein MLD38_028255 [Melastoma candidum]
MGYAQPVRGPACSRKSTYCSSVYGHCQTVGQTMHEVNLNPAAENVNYPVAMDIRELVSLDDVMEELGLGPRAYSLSMIIACKNKESTDFKSIGRNHEAPSPGDHRRLFLPWRLSPIIAIALLTSLTVVVLVGIR